MNDQLQILPQVDTDRELFRVCRPVVRSDRKGQQPGLKDQACQETIKLVERVFTGTAIPQVVIFAAVERGSGCSWMCARTAEILSARVEGLVCLVDANFHSPSLHRHFEIEDPGNSNDELASAPAQQLVRPGRSNLWLLSYAPVNGDWRTPLSFYRLESRLSELRKNFTYVLIDAPPINAYADATLLGRMADGMVMILEANTTRREAARRAKDSLDAAGIRLLGAVLNKRTFPIPERLYSRL